MMHGIGFFSELGPGLILFQRTVPRFPFGDRLEPLRGHNRKLGWTRIIATSPCEQELIGGIQDVRLLSITHEPLEDRLPEGMTGPRGEGDVPQDRGEATASDSYVLVGMCLRFPSENQLLPGQEAIERTKRFEVEMNVDATVTVHDEIAHLIRALDPLIVSFKDRQENPG